MLIKYYGPKTCYDGVREFTVQSTAARKYPDEYLIANILQVYIKQRVALLEKTNRQIEVLLEPWNARDGGANTDAINDLILSTVAANLDSEKEILILVPFLYGYHHPGIAVLIKPGARKVIYIDPFGRKGYYGYTHQIGEKLEASPYGFKFSVIETRQQQSDGTSCGPILTASMFKFIDEFIGSGDITEQGFQAPRPKLATDRMQQINLNNSALDFSDLENRRGLLVNELMLADEELWIKFIVEQGISEKDPTYCAIRVFVHTQKQFIERLPADWHSDENCRDVVANIPWLQDIMTGIICYHGLFINSLPDNCQENEQVARIFALQARICDILNDTNRTLGSRLDDIKQLFSILKQEYGNYLATLNPVIEELIPHLMLTRDGGVGVKVLSICKLQSDIIIIPRIKELNRTLFVKIEPRGIKKVWGFIKKLSPDWQQDPIVCNMVASICRLQIDIINILTNPEFSNENLQKHFDALAEVISTIEAYQQLIKRLPNNWRQNADISTKVDAIGEALKKVANIDHPKFASDFGDISQSIGEIGRLICETNASLANEQSAYFFPTVTVSVWEWLLSLGSYICGMAAYIFSKKTTTEANGETVSLVGGGALSASPMPAASGVVISGSSSSAVLSTGSPPYSLATTL